MMTYATYPTFLPLPLSEYSSKTETNTVTTTFQSGRPRRRRLGVTHRQEVKLMWMFSPDEYDAFYAWWQHVLEFGTQPFQVTLSSGLLEGTHTFLISDELDMSNKGYFWQVSCPAVLLSKPLLTEAQHQLNVGFESTTGYLLFPSFEDVLDTVINVDYPTAL